MTDPAASAKSPEQTIGVSLTQSATVALSQATELYVQSVVAQARAFSGRQEVAAEHVERAVRQMSPAYESAGLKVALDWIKRVGFLIVGIAIVQFGQLLADVGNGIATVPDVVRVLILVVAGAILVVVAVAIDVPALANWNAARKLKRKISAGPDDSSGSAPGVVPR
jgi:uncharacterized membrane protein YidH (DUF202 family)